jgi:toxin CptA
MSIAVSVPIVPSRLLRLLTLAYAAACIAMGAACAAGLVGPVLWPAATGALCMLAGTAVAWRTRAEPTPRTLDVLGPATLALTVQLNGGRTHRFVVRLLPDSTLWPGLLVLRLAGAPPLVLLRDSVPPGSFRQLVMALRAVSGRAVETVPEKPKIL